MGKIDAILMASGFSERFGGENKLLTEFKGKPLVEHTLELACSCGFNRVILAAADEKVAEIAKKFDATIIKNEHPEHGLRESVRLGVLESDADFYMFFTCDQPLLDKETVEMVLKSAQDGKISYPVFQWIPGHPSLFSKTYREELLTLEQGESPKVLKARHRKSCVEILVDSPNVVFDVDTKRDIEQLKEIE